jgi:hypothetical protein
MYTFKNLLTNFEKMCTETLHRIPFRVNWSMFSSADF